MAKMLLQQNDFVAYPFCGLSCGNIDELVWSPYENGCFL